MTGTALVNSDSSCDMDANWVALSPSRTVRGAHTLRASILIRRPVDEVFAFFSDAHNLQRITPSYLDFKVLTPAPIEMNVGTLIDYKLRVRGIPFRWRSSIDVWDPPHRFVDRQVRGPYRLWHHEHTFESVADGTSVNDIVTFKPPGGALLTHLFVGRDVKRIFAYRSEVLKRILATDGVGRFSTRLKAGN